MIETTTERSSGTRTLGPGQLLVTGYGVFVVAATGRSAVQLATQASRAPLAYALSALAALVYWCGFVATLRAVRGRPVRAARAVAKVELAGVLVVGTASLLVPAAFPDATVWSAYGLGYAFVPLALPVAVLWWTRVSRPTSHPAS
ncbi:hypothetical protein [Cellulomonas sp. HZM]|uniref:hypothetical protein n=1 Tax=Cellulomonas sp. HZM TaxID=1454010 RepID=UPI0004936388|nr:hypothetical protein [Cellulomonas sp. HZM]